MTPTITRWDGCYREGWQDLIVPEAFAHPAKYSRGLIHRIYRHLLERGYVRPGQTVLDPFGGASLGAIDAATYGLQWIGVELEENFRIISHKNMLLWCQERWCTCGDDGAAYVSALRQSVSAGNRASQSSQKGEQTGAVLFAGMQQQSLFHREADQRDDPPEIPGTHPLEQGQALVSSDEADTLSTRQQWESPGREERALARGTLSQFHGVCGDTRQREAQTGTSSCDGTDAGTTLEAQRACPPSQRRQDGQSPREPHTDDRQSAHETSQPPWPTTAREDGAMPSLRGDDRDHLHGITDTNRLFLDTLSARQRTGIPATLPQESPPAAANHPDSVRLLRDHHAASSPQGHTVLHLQDPDMSRGLQSASRARKSCPTCGKLLVPLPVLLQGDSRVLRQVLAGAEVACCVGSPPFCGSLSSGETAAEMKARWSQSQLGGSWGQSYGSSPGQLGALPPGTPPACVVGSPPYANAEGSPSLGSVHKDAWGTDGRSITTRRGLTAAYGTTPGQLGALPPGTPPAAVVSSPPYAGAGQVLGTHNGIDYSKLTDGGKERTPARVASGEGYGTTPGQLGNMAVVGSPPYAEGLNGRGAGDGPGMAGNVQRRAAIKAGSPTERAAQSAMEGYGHSAGQLGAMPAGAIISSPPYGDQEDKRGKIKWEKTHHGSRAAAYGAGQSSDADGCEGYGHGAGQLGAMPAGANACISSPPYEAQVVRARAPGQHDPGRQGVGAHGLHCFDAYGSSPDQLGNTTGDTFWSAASQIVAECAALLPVGAVACWVLKGYVSKGRLVDFPAQWLALCQAHGFRLVEEIHASLVEDHGTQEGLFGDAETLTTERKSFFRRLHERKPGAVRIDHETVLILIKEV